jgi:membrane associated rhomboid family serine protease
MALGIEPIQVGILVALVVAFGYLWMLAGRGTWYDRLTDRWLFGIPWGTLVSIAVVVGFYLFAQNGLAHWNSPVTVAFRSWSYTYVEGLLTAGFAHASPAHLTSNLIGTIVLAPIVEYAWSHYPPRERVPDYTYPPPGKLRSVAETGYDGGPLYQHPWVRAVVLFPGAVIAVSVLTSVLAFGWSLGFSGTVFAFGGFAVIYFPLAAVVAMVGFTGTSIVFFAIQEPVLRATADPGAPGPPGWWGINVQAHLLGFLIGIVLALVVLRHRGERRRPDRVFLAVLVFGLVRQLYSFTSSGGEEIYLQLRGLGLIFVLGLTVLVTASVVTDQPAIPGEAALDRLPIGAGHRIIGVLWLALLAVLGWSLWSGTVGAGSYTPLAIAFVPLLLILSLLPLFRKGSPKSRKRMFVVALVALAVVVAIPSFPGNFIPMNDEPVPDGETVSIADYEITYAENVEHGRIGSEESGLVVVSERRQVWTTPADKSDLEHDGEATVPVGGFGWRETVTATRSGWDVIGGDAAYVVDLRHDGASIRSFTSEGSTARAEVAGRTITVRPDGEEFLLEVSRDNETVGQVPVPEVNETAAVDGLEFVTELVDDRESVFAREDGTRVLIAQRERYD